MTVCSLPLCLRQRAAGQVRNELPGERGHSQRGEIQPRYLGQNLQLHAGHLQNHHSTHVREFISTLWIILPLSIAVSYI